VDGTLQIIAGGFLLGLAGSLHCACMCGGIASGALFLLKPETQSQRLISLLTLQAGRISSYALAGGVAAGLTSGVIDPNSTAVTFRVLQWVAAVGLMWIGLSTAGMLPRLAMPVFAPANFAGLVDPFLAPLRKSPRLAPFAMGVSWGLTPCPMVYAALFTAALSGSFATGALWMLAFGAGTLPGVVGGALGISVLARTGRGPAAEMAAGALIAAFGFTSLYYGWPGSSVLCLTQ